MSWILIAILAYFILAIANLTDKFLVTTVLTSSKTYALVACVLGIVVVLAAPWFLQWPGLCLFSINFLLGGVFVLALWLLYEALRRGEASRILVFIGGITPVFSLIFSLVFFHEYFSGRQWLGIATLLAGIFIIAFLPQARSYLTRVLNKLRIRLEAKTGGLLVAFFSALAYAVYFVGIKHAYASQPFFSGFIWTRLGAAFFVLFFLIRKKDRQEIARTLKQTKRPRHQFLVVFNQGLGSVGFILQNYAVFLGSVALVNALQGVQYAFILVISAVLAVLSPKLLKETFSWRIVLQKFAAVAMIALGLYALMI